MNRSSKRQRKEDPPSWLQNHSLACVASPWGGEPIRTPVATASNKELFLQRLHKEIIGSLEWNRDKKDPNPNIVWKKRIVMGTNQCTRALEKAMAGNGKPSLVVLARDVYPPTMLCHIPVMAEQIKGANESSLPILLLPGKSSKELGRVFGTGRVSILVFLEEEKETEDQSVDEKERKQHDIITSFSRFVKDSLL